jgi:hypothetical protein
MTNVHNDDLSWLTAERPATSDHDPSAHDRALHELRAHMAPSPARHLRPLRALTPQSWRKFAVPVALSAAAVGAAAVVIATEQPTNSAGIHHSAPLVSAAHPSPLIRLAADVTKAGAQSGNATLVARSTAGGTVYDLYTDSGQYYFSPTESGLAAQVRAGNNLAGGLFAREVAAAKLAANGNVRQAAQDMANAPDPRHPISPETVPTAAQRAAVAAKAAAINGRPGSPQGGIVQEPGTLYDNYVWENSQDALVAGSGDPAVRAGVLRILATLPGVIVTNTTTNGAPTLTLTASASEVGVGFAEQITINAETGIAVDESGGSTSDPNAGTTNYSVSRVDTGDLSAGNHAG